MPIDDNPYMVSGSTSVDFSTSGTSIANSSFCSTCNCWWTGYHNCFTPTWTLYAQRQDKTQIAFNIAKSLMAKDMVNVTTVEQFTKLVDEILGQL